MWSSTCLLLALALPLPQDADALFDAAEAARFSGASEDAERRFLELLEAHPDHLEAHRSYQKLLLHLEREEELLRAYRARLDAAPDRALWHLLVGALVADPEREEAHYRAGLELEPENPELFLALARVLLKQLRREEALGAIEEAARLDPERMAAQLGTIQVLRVLERETEAVERLRSRRAAEPEEGRWQMLLGLALLQAGETGEAIEMLRAYTVDHPDDVRGAAFLGFALLQEGNAEAAREQAGRARALDPFDERALELETLVQGFLGDDVKQAIEVAATFARIEPTRSRSHSLLGLMLVRSGEHAAAEASFRRALRWDPSDPEAVQGLANVALKRGDLRRATEHLEHALEISPRNFEALILLGRLYGNLGETEAAERTLARAEALRRSGNETVGIAVEESDGGWAFAEREANEAWLRERLAWLALHAGRVDEALEAFARILETDPDAWAERWALARLLQSLGRADEAIAEYERLSALLQGTEHEGVGICSAIRAADCRWARGERDAAEATYRDLLERFGERVPDHEHLDALVGALDEPHEAPRRRAIEGLDLASTEDPQSGAARALAAVLRQQGLAADEDDLARRLERPGLPQWRAVQLALEERDDVDVFLFDGRWAAIRELLDAGRPVLQSWGRPTATGAPTAQLTIIAGYDEELGVALLEKPDLLAAMSRVPTRAVERRATLLVTPQGALSDEEAAALPGRDVHALMAVALDADLVGDRETARSALARAHELDPQHPGVALQHAFSVWQSGDREAAVELLDAVRSVPSCPSEVPATLGKMYVETGRPKEAETLLRAALLDEPRDANVHEYLITLLGGQPGRGDDALAAAEAFVAALPSSGEARRARGVVRYNAGRTEEALEDFVAAAARAPSARNLRDLGVLLGQLGRWEDCVRALERAVESERDPAARAQLERLLTEARSRAGQR